MSTIQPDYRSNLPYQLYKYFFNNETKNLAAGIPILTPDPDDVILGASIYCFTAFDGSTVADLVFQSHQAKGLFAQFTTGATPVSLAAASAAFGNSVTEPIADITQKLHVNNPPAGNQNGLLLVVNQTGLPGGAASAAAQGSGLVVIAVAQSISINPTDPPLPLN